MGGAFNVVMRIVSSLIGIAMILMGMGWTIYGAILALVGVAQVFWSNTRQSRT
jgi:hypothetical protein